MKRNDYRNKAGRPTAEETVRFPGEETARDVGMARKRGPGFT